MFFIYLGTGFNAWAKCDPLVKLNSLQVINVFYDGHQGKFHNHPGSLQYHNVFTGLSLCYHVFTPCCNGMDKSITQIPNEICVICNLKGLSFL